MRIRNFQRSAAKAGFGWRATAGVGDHALPTVDCRRAVQAHDLEGLVATVTGVTASYCANRSWFQLRARRIGTGTEVETQWTQAMNESGSGELSADLVRRFASLSFDYGGAAYFYETAATVTPIVGGTVEVLLAADDARNPDGSPAFVGGYKLKDEAGRTLARFDHLGYETHRSVGANMVAVAARQRGRLVTAWEPHPANPARADARVLRAALPIDVLHRTRLYTKTVMERGAGRREVAYVRNDGPAPISDAQLVALERRLQQHARSSLGGVLTLPAEVEITEVGSVAVGAEVQGLTEASIRSVLDVWLMPPSLIGRGGDRTYENQATEVVQWLRSLVVPRLQLLAAAIPRDTGVEHYIDTSGCPLFGEDYAPSAVRAAQLWADDIITLGEYRRLAGLPELDDADDRAGRYRSELAAGGGAAPFLPAGPGPQETQRALGRADNGDLARRLDAAAAVAAEPLIEYAQAQHERFARMAVGAIRRRAGLEREDGDAPVPPDLGADDLIDEAARTAEVADDLVPLYEQMADELLVAHTQATELAGLADLATAMRSPAAATRRYTTVLAAQRERLVLGDGGAYEGWVGSIRGELEDALAASKGRGESVDQLIARVHRVLGTGTSPSQRYRAELIGRTESVSLSNALAEAQWADSGLVRRKQWYSIGDNRTRRSHAQVNGTVVGWGEDFFVGGHKAARPHDPRLPSEEVIACRCRLIPLVD